MLQACDLSDDVPMFHQINGQEFVLMSKARFDQLFKAEIERDTLKAAIASMGDKRDGN